MTTRKTTSTSETILPECAEFFGRTTEQIVGIAKSQEIITRAQERIASVIFDVDGILSVQRRTVDKLAEIDERHKAEKKLEYDRAVETRKFKWDSFVAVLAAVLSLATGIMVFVISTRLAPLLAAHP